MEPIPSYGDHITLEHFIEYCEAGAFIDYDGFGYYATAYEMTDIIIKPSDVKKGEIDTAYSHIVWFNR